MKITIKTNYGPRDCLGYETCVHGLVANRVDGNGRRWTLTHLGSGRHFGVALKTLDGVRSVARAVTDLFSGFGREVGWNIRLDGARPHLHGDWRTWAVQFRRLALAAGAQVID